MFIHVLDALEKGFVEGDFVLQLCQEGSDFLFRFSDNRSFVGTHEGIEDACHPVERDTALLVGQDGVFEGGLFLVGHYLVHFLALLLDSSLNGRQIVGWLDFAEVGRTIGQRACQQQGAGRGHG